MFREHVVENQIQIYIRAIPDCFPQGLMHVYSCVTYMSMHCTCS